MKFQGAQDELSGYQVELTIEHTRLSNKLPTASLMWPELSIAATVAAATAALIDANDLSSFLGLCEADVEAIGPAHFQSFEGSPSNAMNHSLLSAVALTVSIDRDLPCSFVSGAPPLAEE